MVPPQQSVKEFVRAPVSELPEAPAQGEPHTAVGLTLEVTENKYGATVRRERRDELSLAFHSDPTGQVSRVPGTGHDVNAFWTTVDALQRQDPTHRPS